MKIEKLLAKLTKEDKLKITTPSEEVSSSYNEKSENSLKAAKILFSQKLFEESISMSYYAMYNQALSLLHLIGIKSENHLATIHLLQKLFKISTHTIKNAKSQRINTQYYTNTKSTKNDAKTLIENSEDFLEELNYLKETITKKEILNLTKEAKELLKV